MKGILFVFTLIMFLVPLAADADKNNKQPYNLNGDAAHRVISQPANINILSQATFNLPMYFDYIATNPNQKGLHFDEGANEGRIGILSDPLKIL